MLSHWKELLASDGEKLGWGKGTWHVAAYSQESESDQSTVMAEAWEGVEACSCEISATTVKELRFRY